MKKIDLELAVGTTPMSELRPALDAAIKNHFAEGVMSHRWEGEVVRLSGPGARGTLVCEAGRLKLSAQLKPPASWVHKVIRNKIDAALADVAADLARNE